MCRAKLIAVLACALGVVNADIQPNWDKLTDFSAKFSQHFDSSEIPYPLRDHIEYEFPRTTEGDGVGEINIDVFGQRAYVKGHGSFTTIDGLEGNSVSEMYFDAPSGHLAIKLQGKYPEPMGVITLEPSCVKIRFPQGMLPPGGMVKEQFEQTEPMVTQMLNQMPHSSATVDGESVQVYSNNDPMMPMYFGIHDDATPAGFGLKKPEDAAWNPEFKITEWSQGAQIPDDMNCAEMSAEELLATPYAKQSLRSLDRVMAVARSMKPLQHALQHIPAQPSLLVEGAKGTSRRFQTSTPAMMPTMVFAFAAGTLASLLVFAVLKPRQARRTSLLDNMA